jgi:hypothetical protein
MESRCILCDALVEGEPSLLCRECHELPADARYALRERAVRRMLRDDASYRPRRTATAASSGSTPR